jgi:hypothetical protein
MMFAEEFEMFVIEPIFHGSLNWNSPVIPILFVLCFFIPLSILIIKSTYFKSSSY